MYKRQLFDRNLLKKVIGLDIMDSGVFLLLADRGYITGRTVPIIVDGVTSMEHYVNPIPAGLVLTGIVVSVSVSAVMLSLTVRIYQTYRTLDTVSYTHLSPNSAAPQQRHSSSQSACRKISKMLSLIRFSMKGSSCKNRWKETQCPFSIP